MSLRRATTQTARATALAAALILLPAGSADARTTITGRLDRGGYTVVAVAPSGKTARARGGRSFKVVPPAKVVSLHLLDRNGVYFGPVVVGRRGERAIVGVRRGARLGVVRVKPKRGYARVARKRSRRWISASRVARAQAGVPLGAGAFGRVRSRATGPAGRGLDRDLDGIPGLYDVDDDGDLIPDVSEGPGRAGVGGGALAVAAPGLLAACPGLVCEGRLSVEVTDADKADLALLVAGLAALLAALSLALQLGSAVRGRRRGVFVEARMGIPVYQQGGGEWGVFIEVLNRTDHPVRWVSAALETRDGRSLYLMQHPAGGELPAVISPQDSHHTWARTSELERSGIDLRQSLRAVVKLDTGEILRSKQTRMLSRRG